MPNRRVRGGEWNRHPFCWTASCISHDYGQCLGDGCPYGTGALALFWPNNRAIHVANRGVAIYKSWLYFRMTPDNYLVSLNPKDGKEHWRQQIADVKDDYFSAASPLVIGNHVIVGPGNNDNVRAWLESRDPETGAQQWKWWVDPAPGARSSNTWPDDATMAKGGGFPWLTGTYDPQLNLYYFGTGNGVPEDRKPHPTDHGDSLYTASVVALNPDTGKLVWAYQITLA